MFTVAYPGPEGPKKYVFETAPPPPLSQGLGDQAPPPLSEDLDQPLVQTLPDSSYADTKTIPLKASVYS